MTGRWLASRAGLAAATLCATVAGVTAQPESSFRTTCGGLRAALATLPGGEDVVSIEVTGQLRHVRSDGALAYLGLCGAPDPQVLCVAYSTNDRQVGDHVLVRGQLDARGPDRVLLDPCLHSLSGPP